MKIAYLAFTTILMSGVVAADNAPKSATADKDRTTAKLADDDVKLVAHIHHVNMMEIDMGKLAQKMGSAGGVKSYGATLIKDHTDGDKDLSAFARTRGLAAIPADDGASHADMKAKMAELQKLKGPEFDRQFLTMMQADHQTEIAKLTTAMPNIKDKELQTKMKDLQPVLQRHADAARDLLKATPTAKR
jgi:putative membrane protein